MSMEPPVCPDCGSPLGSSPPARCTQCQLPLIGPDAFALWQVTGELRALDARRQWLVQRHAELLTALRRRRDAPAGVPAPASAGIPAFAPLGGSGGGGGATGARRREFSAPSARTALLIVGGVLVVVAALVFTVVSWGRLGIGGRAAVLLALTACALALPGPLRRRRLTATAEASAAVGLALVLLDGYAARQAGLAGLDRVGTAGYWAMLTALTALGAMAYGWWLRLRLPLPVGFLMARLPGLLGAAAMGGTAEAYATAIIGTAAVDFAALYALTAHASANAGLRDRWGSERTATTLVTAAGALSGGWALLGGVLAVGQAVVAPSAAEALRAWVPLGLLVLLGTALCRGFRRLPFALRSGGEGVAVVAFVVAVGAGSRHVIPAGWAVAGYAIPAAVIAVWAAVCCVRIGRWATPARGGGAEGPHTPPREAAAALGGLIAASTLLLLSGVVALPELAQALLRPVVHGVALWGNGHPELAPTPTSWSWRLATAPLVVLWLCASVLAAMAALRARAVGDGHPDRLANALHHARVPAAVPALLLLPVALGLPYGWVLAAAAVATAAVAVDLMRRREAALPPRLLALATTGALALLWSSADRVAVLAVCGSFAVAAGVLAHVLAAPTARPGERATACGAGAFAVLALGVEAIASGVTAGLPSQVTAFLVLAVAIASAGAAAVWQRLPGRAQVSTAVEGTGYALASVTLSLTLHHPTALSLVLAVTGLAGLAIALRPDRRHAALAGTALLIASSWVRLALAGVSSPEAYTLPVTAAALVIGHRRRTSTPATGSWPAYGAGLSATMLPSLVAVWSDENWVRPLLLGVAALLATVIGARTRLQAPLVAGTGVLVLVGLHELAPTVVQVLGLLPRWVPLAAAGLLLLLLGATYEKRIGEARRLRDTVRGMG
ncbi:SCO7613 C-terminal domain-containing membrane protein [Streptomyces sp. NPDC058773]|uniref:SCO7613 C-terminal domain-containing membrane protein n=1 Tax=Streptomyces sp. NPDC058773 TaxID=3346632 RepID=UPI0036A51227